MTFADFRPRAVVFDEAAAAGGMRCVGSARGELAAHLTAGTVTPELVVSSLDESLGDVGCWLVA